MDVIRWQEMCGSGVETNLQPTSIRSRDGNLDNAHKLYNGGDVKVLKGLVAFKVSKGHRVGSKAIR